MGSFDKGVPARSAIVDGYIIVVEEELVVSCALCGVHVCERTGRKAGQAVIRCCLGVYTQVRICVGC